MPLELGALEGLGPEAVKHFWLSRRRSAEKQALKGGSDQGARSAVTSGKNLDGFIALTKQLILDNAGEDVEIFDQGRAGLTVPGFFRPVKNWDLLVMRQGRLLALFEFKSQAGSFGNNFNNRVEEAIGNAVDVKTAFREGVFGDAPKPFMGYVFVLEECEGSTRPVNFSSPHFPARPEFKNTSYAARYDLFCRKLVLEELYGAAALVLTQEESGARGEYTHLSELTSLRGFAAAAAGAVAAGTAV